MTYSPTDRLHRRFASSESLSTSCQVFLEDLDLCTVKFLPKHRVFTLSTVSCLEPYHLNCQGSVPSPEFGGLDESDFHSQSGQWLADRIHRTTIIGTNDSKVLNSKSSIGRVEDSRAKNARELNEAKPMQRVYTLIGYFRGFDLHSVALKVYVSRSSRAA
ncbi:MAG: hypothetical protein U7123_05720 [Potamolinea sp.]